MLPVVRFLKTNFMYAIDDRFFSEIQDIAEHLECEFLVEQTDDFTVEAYECDLEFITQLDGDSIADCIDDERLSEDGDEKEDVAKILNGNIDFDKINALMPKLWYPSNRKVVFTKAELIAASIRNISKDTPSDNKAEDAKCIRCKKGESGFYFCSGSC